MSNMKVLCGPDAFQEKNRKYLLLVASVWASSKVVAAPGLINQRAGRLCLIRLQAHSMGFPTDGMRKTNGLTSLGLKFAGRGKHAFAPAN